MLSPQVWICRREHPHLQRAGASGGPRKAGLRVWCGVVAAHHHAAPAHAQDLTSGGFPKVVCRVWFGRAKVRVKIMLGEKRVVFWVVEI